MTVENLTIPGHRGIAIPATLTRSGGRELAILLPGLTDGRLTPPMQFSRLLMEERRADVLMVDYAYGRAPGFSQASDDEQFAWIGADGRAAFSLALELGAYERITVIGKSAGTIAMGWAIPDDPRLADADLVWLTPSLEGTGLHPRMLGCRQRSLVIIGTRDPGYDEAVLDDFRAAGMTVVVIEGADHGLQRPADAGGSLAVLSEMVEQISAWLDQRR